MERRLHSTTKPKRLRSKPSSAHMQAPQGEFDKSMTVICSALPVWWNRSQPCCPWFTVNCTRLSIMKHRIRNATSTTFQSCDRLSH
jgi:hypothetical protein